jgi:hypothetical protein
MVPCCMIPSHSSQSFSASPRPSYLRVLRVSAFSSLSPVCHPEPSEGSGYDLRIARLASSHHPPITNPFTIRTYEKCASKPFRIRTSKTQDLKPFRIRTYGKNGRGAYTRLPACPVYLEGRNEGELRGATSVCSYSEAPRGRKYCVPLTGSWRRRRSCWRSSLRSTKSMAEVLMTRRSEAA